MSQPLTIVAIVRAKPGTEAALRAAQERLVADTLSEDGCLRYELHQSVDDGRVLIFVESWRSDAAWRAYMSGGAMQRFQAAGVGDHFAGFELHRMMRVAG